VHAARSCSSCFVDLSRSATDGRSSVLFLRLTRPNRPRTQVLPSCSNKSSDPKQRVSLFVDKIILWQVSVSCADFPCISLFRWCPILIVAATGVCDHYHCHLCLLLLLLLTLTVTVFQVPARPLLQQMFSSPVIALVTDVMLVQCFTDCITR
jgi:hypothetical protein